MTATAIAATSNPLGLALGIAIAIAILGWILILVLLITTYLVMVAVRGRAQKSREAGPPPRAADASEILAGLGEIRRRDPDFDEQLLFDAAQTATLLAFTAISTGDTAPIMRMVADSYWSTPFGRYVSTVARDRRRAVLDAENAAIRRRNRNVPRLPLDYHADLPRLARVALGDVEEIDIRVSFSGLVAMIARGATAMASGAAARGTGQAVLSLTRAVGDRLNDSGLDEVSWVASSGSYELSFIRPAGAHTDPLAVLSDRVCARCGAAFDSELAVACASCRTARPLPWGQWRLVQVQVVDPGS